MHSAHTTCRYPTSMRVSRDWACRETIWTLKYCPVYCMFNCWGCTSVFPIYPPCNDRRYTGHPPLSVYRFWTIHLLSCVSGTVSVQLTRILGTLGTTNSEPADAFLALVAGCGLGCLGFWCIQRRRRNRKDYQLLKLDVALPGLSSQCILLLYSAYRSGP
jgi:hypothetical protein